MPAHYFSNSEIADLLRNVAAALQLADEDKNRFRIISYNRAADSIEHASSDIKDLWDNHELDQVAGIGESITSYLDELFKTGKVKHFNQILKINPPAFYELLKIPGIGPRTASKLISDLGISKKAGWLAKLKKAAAKGRVPEHLVTSIANFSLDKKRLLLHQASLVAGDILSYMKTCPQVLEIQPLGSLRRQVSTVGDIDIAVSTHVPTSVISHFCSYPKKSQVLDAGNTKASIQLRDGLRLDIMTCEPDQFGSLLQHFTGSKHHNIALREYALKMGYSLSEYGIKKTTPTQPPPRLGGGARRAEGVVEKNKGFKFSSEKDFYNFLKLDFIPPELREDTGEIQLAKSHSLPQLVELSDIKGDLHVHSSFDTETSHDLGQHSLSILLERAKLLKYEYLGLTEHNPAMATHTSRNIYSILANKQDITKQYNNSGVHIFNGLEVDITSKGELSLPENCLDLLDYVIVSIHSSFIQSQKVMTERVLKALSHPKAKILGHPTGRLLNEREGISLDWDQLFDFCLKHKKILEIDSWPNRLDLPDSLVREAVKAGVKMVINTDSHSVDHMEYIRYGVSVARRGWAQKSDIINTLNLKQIKEVILST